MFSKFIRLIVMLALLLAFPYGIVLYMHEDTIKIDAPVDTFDRKLQEYCINALAQEVSPNYSEEMLKVQAILVRTTVYKKVEELGKEMIQVEGWNQEKEIDILWKQRLEKAWRETEGQVVMYEENLALVPFHQMSGGKTRNATEVLGSEDYPYIQSVECRSDTESPNQIQSVFIPVKSAEIVSQDEAGYVTEVLADGEKISGEEFRETYGLASSCFEIQSFNGETRIITKGIGHGLGLSQYTANEMAKDGNTSKEILQFFFPGTEIKEVAEILWNIE